MRVLLDEHGRIIAAFLLTLKLTGASAVVAFMVGIVLAAARISPLPVLRRAGAVYVGAVRNVPLTLVVLFCGLGLGSVLNLRFSADESVQSYWLTVIGLGGYTAAFVCEVLRAGMATVPVGQAEAARALGLTFPQTVRLVVLPQAVRNVVGPLGGLLIALTKNTTVAAAIGVLESATIMKELFNDHGDAVIPIFLAFAAAFLAVTLPTGLLFSRLAGQLTVRQLGAAGAPIAMYDVPGPRARLRGNALSVAFTAVLLGAGWLLWRRLADTGQFDARLWAPFGAGQVWGNLILPGLGNTLAATVTAVVLALPFGVLFGAARLSAYRLVRVPAAAVVEFFRAVPLLILIFFSQFAGYQLGFTVSAFVALTTGLVLYNGSVLAEIFRAGIRAVPIGQAEAGYALGLSTSGVMRLILLPQAVTAMMPAIVGQLVVLLKDTALGFIISYNDLLYQGLDVVAANYQNFIPAAIVVALIYIAVNLALGRVVTWLERRGRTRRAGPVRDTVTIPVDQPRWDASSA
ncbi:amino acid ABC transporter permease [Nonomuraea sp. NPDC049269]|uniref:amino acid ABC transporter permease n=1 Tax=Nonomuraea sp. NPDC049269 TaxID=3364349 RepID=UPI003724274C